MTTWARPFPRADSLVREVRAPSNPNPSDRVMSEIDPDSAVSALTDIARVERRALEASHFADASNSCFLWAALTSFGYVFHHFEPDAGRWAWVSIDILGVVAMAALGVLARMRRGPEVRRALDHRPSLTQGAVLVFGSVCYLILTGGRAEYRVSATYFPTIFMFGMVVMGLWIGRFLIVVGIAVTLLVLAAYLWSGPWFDFLMALCVGGVLAAGGFRFRRMDTKV